MKNDKWVDTFFDFEDIEAETPPIAGALQDLGLQKGDRCTSPIKEVARRQLAYLKLATFGRRNPG